MRTRIGGRPQLWCRRTPTPEPFTEFAPPIFNELPDDDQKPSLILLALAGLSYTRFKATLHKLRRDARLILVTDEDQLAHAVTHEKSTHNRLAGIIIADAEIIHPLRRGLARTVAALLHDTDTEWTVIFAFDFALQAWRNRQMFARFMKWHFAPALRWEIGALMAVKHRMVLRRRVLRKMGPRVYRKKYRMRGVIFLRVKQADKVVVVENEEGHVDVILPDRTCSSATREEPDTPSTCEMSGEEVFDCQMGVVGDFEEDEVRGVVDGDEGGGGRPSRRSEYWVGLDVDNEDLQTPTYSDFPSSNSPSSLPSSSGEEMVVASSVIEDNQSDIDVADDADEIEDDTDGIEERDVDDHSQSQNTDNDTDNGDNEKPNENNNSNNTDWVPSDDERATENTRRRCTVALHEFKNWRQNEETGKEEIICSFLGLVGHVEDNRSLASIILGMCSVVPSR